MPDEIKVRADPRAMIRVRRRTVVRAAAWATPVVTVASAAPAFAATSTVFKLTATNSLIQIDNSSASPQSLQGILTADGNALGSATITFTNPTSWLHLSASSATSDAGGQFSLPVTFDTTPPFGAQAKIVGTYTDPSTSNAYQAIWTLTYYVPNVYVVRLGTGSAAVSSAATPVFLDQFTPAGAPVSGGTVTLPTASTTAAPFALTMSGTATSEGALSLAPDRKHVALAGYNVTSGTASVAGTSSATVPTNMRVVGLVSKSGSADTSTGLATAYSGNNPRGAVTSDGTAIWASGAGSTSLAVVYTVDGSNATPVNVSATSTNNRVIQAFNGDLYFSTGAGTTGVYRISGLPTSSGNAASLLAAAASPYGFVFMARNGAALDTLYVAQDKSAAVLKFYLVGSTWTAAGSFTLSGGCLGLTGYGDGTTSNAAAVLFATTNAGDKLLKIVDTADYNAPMTATASTVATAATNTVLRGVSFVPDH